MLKYIIGMLFLIIWIYIISVLKRTKLDSFLFIWGSVGFFLFSLFYLSNTLITPFLNISTTIAGWIGELTNTFSVFSNYGILAINSIESINLYIDFECSGILEILTFVGMVMFFPAYKMYEKLIIQLFGILYILFANVIRLSFIAIVTYYTGMEYYYITHTILGRLIFLFLIIFLFYKVFTVKQILNQKVGNFNYA